MYVIGPYLGPFWGPPPIQSARAGEKEADGFVLARCGWFGHPDLESEIYFLLFNLISFEKKKSFQSNWASEFWEICTHRSFYTFGFDRNGSDASGWPTGPVGPHIYACTDEGGMQQALLETPSLPRAQGTRQRPKNPRQRLCRAPPSAKSPRKKN